MGTISRTAPMSHPYTVPATANSSSRSVLSAGASVAAVGVAVEAKVIQRIRVRLEGTIVRRRRERPFQVLGQRCTKVHRSTGCRMPKSQPRRVEEMPPRGKCDQPPATTAAVRIVTDDRMPDRREVHADLMRAARMQMRAQQI